MNRVALAAIVLMTACSPGAPAPTPRPAPVAPAAPAWGGLGVVERGDPQARYAMIVLHGYGAPGDDLVPLAEALSRASGARTIVPAAPIPMGPGRAWWEIEGPDRDAQIATARTAIEGVIDTLRAGGIDDDHVIVGGFSQGAMLSLEIGLTHRAPLAGIAILSGRPLPHAPGDYDRLAGVEVFQSHGRADARLSFDEAAPIRDLAREHGAHVTFVPFEGGHAIPGEVQSALAGWLSTITTGAPR